MKNRSDCVQGRARRTGFTLIELLTVIAIIAILASISFAGVSQYLEKAKETQTVANMESVGKALIAYSTRSDNSQGFPPGYGFVKSEARETAVAALVDADFVTDPYTALIGLHGEESSQQLLRYITSYDVNKNSVIDLMEYLPVGEKDPATGGYIFSPTLYDGANSPMSGAVNEKLAQLKDGQRRPFFYVPFNKRQLQTARKYWVNQNDEFGASFDITDPDLDGRMFFPPPIYDGFVLIGSGPGGDTGGVVADPPNPVGGGYDVEHEYHVAALRIAFLATRDWDGDGKLDFDYEARKTVDAAAITPNGERGFGAFIKVVQ